MANVCVATGGDTPVSDKRCYEVECAAQADCCKSFTPSPGCDKYKADCAADPSYCLTYHTFCECNRDCKDELCVDTPPGCTADAECASFLAPHCVSGHCLECAEDGDCKSDTDRCIDGACRPPCTHDEQCPLLDECQAGDCVEVGCKSDLECYFVIGDARSRCDAGKCLVPCTSSVECGAFEVCEAGTCRFTGCNTDEECRVYLGLVNELGDARAVCK